MKKITLVLTILCLFVVASFNLQAQDKGAAIQAEAAEQATELRKAFNLNDKQTKELHAAIYKREKTLNFTDYSSMTKQEKMKFMAEINDNFKQSVMTILSEEQFKKYAEWLEKKQRTAH